jgi:hypothetical protein
MINFPGHVESQDYVHSSTLSTLPELHRQIESHRNLKAKDLEIPVNLKYLPEIGTNIHDLRLRRDFKDKEKRM